MTSRVMPADPESQWDESDYVACLDQERMRFAWCLVRYGHLSESSARRRAEAFYEYEPAHKNPRGLVFHDEAWHWAMLELFGANYWQAFPKLELPSDEYDRACERQARPRD